MTKLHGWEEQKHGEVPIENDEEYIRSYAATMLNRRIFKGVYSERRWVQPLMAYRDVVVINSCGNEELIKDLSRVKERLRDFYGDKIWIGVTDPNCVGAPAGHCLWLKTWNKPFGEHEFRIKEVNFYENEICLSIRSKRLMDSKQNSPSSKENIDSSSSVSEPLNFSEMQKGTEELLKKLYTRCTVPNLITAISFVLTLLAALVTSVLAGVQWLGEFTLRFMREFSNFVNVIMPLLLKLIELVQKTIGGLYLVIVMIFQSWKNQPHMDQPYKGALGYNGQNYPPPRGKNYPSGGYYRL